MRNALVVTMTVAVLMAVSSSGGEKPQSSAVRAWIRFDDIQQDYKGVPYRWLGDNDIHLTIEAEPKAGDALDLLWGSKSDRREALMVINGETVSLTHGGYDGFRWRRVAVPEGVTGKRYKVTFRRGGGKAAFMAEVRLVDTDGRRQPDAEMKLRSQNMKLRTSPASRPQVFPDMRRIWDGETTPTHKPLPDKRLESAFLQAERNARRANEALFRCSKFVSGWLKQADPKTGLISRNLGRDRDIWNAKDSAADNYPFMVLTCALTDTDMFEGRMRDMLRTETKLTSRIDSLPDTWSFKKQDFRDAEPNLDRILFGGSEYVKDGLLPLTEWLGDSPWCNRMLSITDDIWKHANVKTERGNIPTKNVELHGEMLQSLSRVYWMTGDEKYLEWALRLGDYYLLGRHHPTRDFSSLRLRDHGCEVVSGLTELYAAVSFARPAKKKEYRKPIHDMCDRILEVGRNEHGMLHNTLNPKTGKHGRGICDTWGYNYNGIYTVYLLDDVEACREAVRKVLGNLKEHYTDHNWGSADEFADSIEGAINLYNREPVPDAADWIDSEILDMWSKQRSDGVIEGWHGDGNSARTSIMYMLWKTQGLTIRPWRKDVRCGAVKHGDHLCVSLAADKQWNAKLLFDVPRHKTQMHLPVDYPRINQFPEWFTAKAEEEYLVRDLSDGEEKTLTGRQLQDGIAITLKPGAETRLTVTPVE